MILHEEYLWMLVIGIRIYFCAYGLGPTMIDSAVMRYDFLVDRWADEGLRHLRGRWRRWRW